MSGKLYYDTVISRTLILIREAFMSKVMVMSWHVSLHLRYNYVN